MKFGTKLREELYDEWEPYYLEYGRLKKVLKRRDNVWKQEDEDRFVASLESELEKIATFQESKIPELEQRVRETDAAVAALVAEYKERTERRNGEEDQASEVAAVDDDGSDDEDWDSYENKDSLEERFADLETDVAYLVADIHDLAVFSKLNYAGFYKIAKKHDKRTGRDLSSKLPSLLATRPFFKYDWETLIVKLSKIYDLVQTRGHPVQGDSSAGGSQSAFVRQTTKYWVHEDYLVPVKLAIMRHLPVLVFDPKKEFEIKDTAITSIYFDNEDLELYLGRLEKTDGAEAIRLRWYGDVTNKQIFVERKTHREDWTGEKSVKARFPIKEEHVNAFLRGEYKMNDEFQALVEKGKKKQEEVDSMMQLATEVQEAIADRKLGPVMRTFYHRTAFQLPGDARVRISLDTELTMIREDNWDGRIRSGDNWRRTDIGIDFPFDQVLPEDKELFKYGVLEVKLQTELGQEPPQWVRDLVASEMVESVPKFSKFIHGTAMLMPNRVDLVPYWLPQMSVKINEKPKAIRTSTLRFDRPPTTRTPTDTDRGTGTSFSPDLHPEPVSEGEEDEDIAVGVASDEAKYARLPPSSVEEVLAWRAKNEPEDEPMSAKKGKAVTRDSGQDFAIGEDEEEFDARKPYLRHHRRSSNLAQAPANLGITPLATADAFDQNFKARIQEVLIGAKLEAARRESDERARRASSRSEPGAGGEADRDSEGEPPAVTGGGAPPAWETEYVTEFRSRPGQKIAVPVRVEPKVYFANERTFLKWQSFAILISAIATMLLNFVPPGDTVGIISAGAFTLTALLAIAYSALLYVWRAMKLQRGEASHIYYDKYGPTILCIVLLAATALNVGLRFQEL